MIQVEDRDRFLALIIAQADDQDYSESGYVALADENGWAALTSYSHCSCYDTWDSLTQQAERHSPKFDWEGTVEQLIDKAFRREDPIIAGRIADPNDNDYRHLISVYDQILEWAHNLGLPKKGG